MPEIIAKLILGYKLGSYSGKGATAYTYAGGNIHRIGEKFLRLQRKTSQAKDQNAIYLFHKQ